MPLVPFPTVPVAEISVYRTANPVGMFAWRCHQALSLLYAPLPSLPEIDTAQHSVLADQAVAVLRPLSALALTHQIVALEDLITDLGTRLVRYTPGLLAYFPRADDVALQMNKSNAKRPDSLRFSPTDWTEVNSKYSAVYGVRPFDPADIPKLDDLALIRHTVAHHGAIVRAIDIVRFKHWSMTAGQLINPPAAEARALVRFVYTAGAGYVTAVRTAVLDAVMAPRTPGSAIVMTPLLSNLLETFDHFGLLIETTPPPVPHVFPTTPAYLAALAGHETETHDRLIASALAHLRRLYP